MKTVRYILYMLLTIAACSCSEDVADEAGNGCTGSRALQISAQKIPFGQDATSFVSTRATINNHYQTEFAVGDHIGVFAIRTKADGTKEEVLGNLEFVLSNTGLWEQVNRDNTTTDEVIANELYAGDDIEFFAYCPYIRSNQWEGVFTPEEQKTLKAPKSAEDLKSNFYKWIYKDYSTNKNTEGYTFVHDDEEYVKRDLMCTANIRPDENGVLHFQFKHAMAMVAVYYNDDNSNLHIYSPADLKYWNPSNPMKVIGADGSTHTEYTYRFLMVPSNVQGIGNVKIYGLIDNKSIETDGEGEHETIVTDYWQATSSIKENTVTYISIAGNPMESYETAGVDMGFPSGTIWAKYNLGTREVEEMNTSWYVSPALDAAQGITGVTEDGLTKQRFFDRGDYYTWGELYTKYEKPVVTLNADGSISGTYSAISQDGKTKTGLVAGTKLGYFKGTYFDPGYTISPISGNVAGTQFDIVRSHLWKGEWRLPNEDEIKELVANCDISIAGYYYEDNRRYADWISNRDNWNRNNTEYYGTTNQRPIRYLVAIYKFTSKLNGKSIYFPGGTWTDWSIDMLAIQSRDGNGKYSPTSNNFGTILVNGQPDFSSSEANGYQGAYGGMYYFASSASHNSIDCCSYMELRLDKKNMKATVPNIKNSDGSIKSANGVTQDGHRYTGMQIRPVYGGSNWEGLEGASEAKARGMRLRPTEVITNP